MTLQQDCIPVFAGHQTFHPRFGWLKKGFDAVSVDPDIFSDPEAPVRLGVGKNMVEAIRFWGVATKVWARIPHPARSRASLHVPTGFGTALLSDAGFDPFLEHAESLWLLHWFALSRPSALPVWWLTFNQFSAVEFEDSKLEQFCLEEIASTTWSQPNPNSVKKDVDCMLRMYSRRRMKGRQTLDDLLDSPFRDLELVVPSGASGSDFRFVLGSKSTLPSEVIAFACLDFLATSDSRASSATLTRLTVDSGSPGRILKLNEQAIVDALEETAASNAGIALASPGGAAQLTVDGPVGDVAEGILRAYFKRRGSKVIGAKHVSFAGSFARLPLDDNLVSAAKSSTSTRNLEASA
jgi:hypothetical protein